MRLDTEAWTRSPGGGRAPGGPLPSWGGQLGVRGQRLPLAADQRAGLRPAEGACPKALPRACVGMSAPRLVAAQPQACWFLGVESLCSHGFLS